MAIKKPVRRYGNMVLSESKELNRFRQLAGIKPSRILTEQGTDIDTDWDPDPDDVAMEDNPLSTLGPVSDEADSEYDWDEAMSAVDDTGTPTSYTWDPEDEVDVDVDIEDLDLQPMDWRYEAHEFNVEDGITTQTQSTRAEALRWVYTGSSDDRSNVMDFRGWVNDNHPDIAETIDLDRFRSVSRSQRSAERAFAMEIDSTGDGENDTTLGALYMEDRIGTPQYGDMDLLEAYRAENDRVANEFDDLMQSGEESYGASMATEITPSSDASAFIDVSRLSRDTLIDESTLAAFVRNESTHSRDTRFECDKVFTAARCVELGGSGTRTGISNNPNLVRSLINENPDHAIAIIQNTSIGFGQVLGRKGAMDAYAQSQGHDGWDDLVAANAQTAAPLTDSQLATGYLDWFDADPVGAGTASAVNWWRRTDPESNPDYNIAQMQRNGVYTADQRVEIANAAATNPNSELAWFDLATMYNGPAMWRKRKYLTDSGLVTRLEGGGYAWNEDMFLPGQVPPVPPSFRNGLLEGHRNGRNGFLPFSDRLTEDAQVAWRSERYDGRLRSNVQTERRAGVPGSVAGDDTIRIGREEFTRAYWAARAQNPNVTTREVLQQMIDDRLAYEPVAMAPPPGHRDDKVYYESTNKTALNESQVQRFQQLAGIKPSRLNEQTMSDYDTGSWDIEYEDEEDYVTIEDPVDTGDYDTSDYDTGDYDTGEEDLDFPTGGQSIDQEGPAQSVVEPYESFTDDACGPGYIDTGEQCIPTDDATEADWESGEYVDDIDIDADIDIEDSWKYEAHGFTEEAGITTSGQIQRAQAMQSVYLGSSGGSGNVNDFRNFVNDEYPELANASVRAGGVDLGRRGRDNTYARSAYDFEIDSDGDGEVDTTLGAAYVESRIGRPQAGDMALAEAYATENEQVTSDFDTLISSADTSRGALRATEITPSRDPNSLIDIRRLSRESNISEGILAAFVRNEAGQADATRFECGQVSGFDSSFCRDMGGSGTNTGISYGLGTVRELIRDHPDKAGQIVGRTSWGFGQVMGDGGAMNAYAQANGHADWNAAVTAGAAAQPPQTEADLAIAMIDWFESDPVEAGMLSAINWWSRGNKASIANAAAERGEDGWFDLATMYNGGGMWRKTKYFRDAGIIITNDAGEEVWNPEMFVGGVVPEASIGDSYVAGASGRPGYEAFNELLTPEAQEDWRSERYDGRLAANYARELRKGIPADRADPAAIHIGQAEFRRAYWDARAEDPNITAEEVLQRLVTSRQTSLASLGQGQAPGHRDDKVYYESKLRRTIQKAINKSLLKEKIRYTILQELIGGPSMPGGLLNPIPPKVRQDYDKHMHNKLRQRAHDAREKRMDDMVGRESPAFAPGYSEEEMSAQAEYDELHSDLYPKSVIAAQDYDTEYPESMAEAIKIKVTRKWSEDPCELPTLQENEEAASVPYHVKVQRADDAQKQASRDTVSQLHMPDAGDLAIALSRNPKARMAKGVFDAAYGIGTGINKATGGIDADVHDIDWGYAGKRIKKFFSGSDSKSKSETPSGAAVARQYQRNRQMEQQIKGSEMTLAERDDLATRRKSSAPVTPVEQNPKFSRRQLRQKVAGLEGGQEMFQGDVEVESELTDNMRYTKSDEPILSPREQGYGIASDRYKPPQNISMARGMGDPHTRLGKWASEDEREARQDIRAANYAQRTGAEGDAEHKSVVRGGDDYVRSRTTQATGRRGGERTDVAMTTDDQGYELGQVGLSTGPLGRMSYRYAGRDPHGTVTTGFRLPWRDARAKAAIRQAPSAHARLQEAYTQNVYEVECSIRIDKKKGGDKEETLTDIRGIPGVTIVGVVPGSSKESPNYFISTLLLKFEQNNNIPPRNYIKKTLTPGLRKIPGVGSFKVKRIKHLSRAKS